MIKKILFIFICTISINFMFGQEAVSNTSGVLPSDIPLHNSLKYNRFMFNPTFSLVRENKNSLNIYNRNPRASFNDNSQTYFLNYSARFEEKTGVGIGLFQQNVGIFRFFGATLNYAYNLELNRDMNFTFGVNVNYSQSSLKSNLDEAAADDDVINNYENNSVFLLHPGVNFNYGSFDVGVSVGNLVAYNITGSELLTDNFVYSGHIMYTTELDWRTENEIRGMAYASKPGVEELRYGGNVFFEIPKYGWGQLGYNSFFGASIGVGANITKVISVGYTVEPGIGGAANTSEFGATHEFGLAFNFNKQEKRRRRRTSSNPAYEARDSEIRRLKKEILEQNKLIRELKNSKGDTLSQAQRSMSKLERSIQEAKEKEAEAARKLSLQREEEVKLLNEQAEEEERLQSERRLAQEMAEQKRQVEEEERLRSERKLEREMAEQKRQAEEAAAGRQSEEAKIAEEEAVRIQAEEAKIAEEEAAREAEAAKQEAAAEALEAAKQEAEAAEQEVAEEQARIEEEKKAEVAAVAERERVEAEAAKKEEERLASQKRLELEMAAQKAEEERLASQKKLESEMAVQKTEEEGLTSEKKLEREVTLQKDKEAEEERLRQEAEAARLAEEERVRQEAEATRLAEEERVRQEAEATRLAEEERLRQEAEAARLAEEERVRQEAEAVRLAEEERLRQEAEATRLAEEERLRQEAEATRLAEEERLRQEAEATRLAEEERLRQEAEAARLAEEERVRQEAEAARLAEEERVRQEAEAARLAEEERVRQEAEAARLAEEERVRQEAAAQQPEVEREDLDQIQKELDNSSRITNKLIASRDSLLTTTTNLDKREFNKLLESLVNMNDEAEEVKKDSDPLSSKRLTSKNRFIKFAEASRPEAKYATKYIPGYPEGYYLVGNVFRGGVYADRFTKTLTDLGFNNSQIILNPENQYQYVAIEYYADKDQAAENYLNNIGNRYFGDMWILHIAKSRVESLKKLVAETRLIKETVKDDTVLSESLSYIGGHNIQTGYYLITNIFKRENYFERGMSRLKSKGLDPQYFRNPKDNYIYVYLERYDSLDQAKQSLFSNVNNTYDGDLYILKID
ncbi:PorP/SprF family type IX secretion system membrane protein [Aquimarina sp. RZ0]|uniref:PorP/SprF family type IX secretion system membrane protein n=1 Tax=Aquimarina sp. RZ0 TaxID=2607730 RepID=UPI0011F1203D|nr:PorP/SprF family type IX secretion system membrane protein [Aquimarina sp. RZ0]KAA1247362.1 type IX secretion system membrane protein PorP/SprF [Aquimarina sp. RZ0]